MKVPEDRYSYSYSGELPSVRERVLVAPGRGKLHRGAIGDGDRVRRGAEIGSLSGPDGPVSLCAPVAGFFDSWMALDGQIVYPGTPLFAIRGLTRRR